MKYYIYKVEQQHLLPDSAPCYPLILRSGCEKIWSFSGEKKSHCDKVCICSASVPFKIVQTHFFIKRHALFPLEMN